MIREGGSARRQTAVSSRVPWYPPSNRPRNATIVAIDGNPLKGTMAYQNLQADRYLEGDVAITLRLLIDESGAVISATMPASTTRAVYDQLLIRAARDWKFLPAQKQGMPVRYLKLIEIQLKPTAP